jgi:hypothetical protein
MTTEIETDDYYDHLYRQGITDAWPEEADIDLGGDAMMATRYPNVRVELTGQHGPVSNLATICSRAARKAGVPDDEIRAFRAEIRRAGSRDAALQAMRAWFDVR